MLIQHFILYAAFTILVCLKHCLTSPHIIFILADDLGWNDVSFHGSLEIPTPNIDTLAYSGIILNNYYVQNLCTPSRGSLLTGKYPIRLGLQHNVIAAGEPWGLSPNETLLPQYLKSLDYVTHCVGKWHLGHFKKEYLPTRRGFDSFFGIYGGKADYFNYFNVETNNSGLDLHDNDNLAPNYTGQYATDVFTDKAKKIIINHNSSEPLFLFISHLAVHGGNHGAPLQAPDCYLKKVSHIKDQKRRTFAAMTVALDKSVGEIFKTLDEKGMLKNSIIVFSTDNGGAVEEVDLSTGSNWPLKGSKYTLWEGGIRASGFIWSQLFVNSTSFVFKKLMHISDWLPTLYAAAGGDVEELDEIDGYNFWPVFNGNDTTPRDHILLNIDPRWKMEGIRKNQYKLLKGSTLNGVLDNWYGKQGKLNEEVLDTSRKIYQTHLHESEVYKIFWRKCENNFISYYTYHFIHFCHLNKNKNLKECEELVKNHEEIHNMCASVTNSIPKPITVHCGTKPANASSNCKIKDNYCLYDIEKDPCEYNNLASILPNVTEELKQLLDTYRNQTVPVKNKGRDPKSDPHKHGNAWLPWIEEE